MGIHEHHSNSMRIQQEKTNSRIGKTIVNRRIRPRQTHQHNRNTGRTISSNNLRADGHLASGKKFFVAFFLSMDAMGKLAGNYVLTIKYRGSPVKFTMNQFWQNQCGLSMSLSNQDLRDCLKVILWIWSGHTHEQIVVKYQSAVKHSTYPWDCNIYIYR